MPRASASRWRVLLGSALVACFVLLSACNGEPEPTETSADAPPSLATAPDTASLVTILKTDDRFTTLVTALDSARLDSQLTTGDASYTLFAPTNAAFERLPDGTLDDLLTDQQDRLRDILLYHVVEGRHTTAEMAPGDTLRLSTLGGSPLPLSRVDQTVRVGDVDVAEADIETGAGVIHVLRGVLRPPAQ